VIKVVAPAHRHPSNRSLEDFHRYWADSHARLFCNSRNVRRYVQHLTLPEAYGGEPAPSFDGVSMFWYDELPLERAEASDEETARLLRAVLGRTPVVPERRDEPTAEQARALRLARAVIRDDAQLFDRSTTWPMHEKRAYVVAEEKVIVDGEASPSMVKAIWIASKLPGLTHEEFFDRWQHHHGPLAGRIPGLRRYVQNHAVLAAYAAGGQTHEGWSELWFDDLGALRAALDSPEWAELGADGAMLFAAPMGVGVAREGVQKDESWRYDDFGVGDMSEDEVRARLAADGYTELAADPDAPRVLKRAAADEALAVWTSEHLVTIDESDLDLRPAR
jgi:uncharacterized protein (TIGR02118 family)